LETTADDYIRELAKPYNVVPRFRKALIHLKELDNWSDDPLKRETNIARLKKELDTDFQKEYLEEIKEKMWTELGPIIMESARKDLQEWADALYPKEEEIVEQHDEDFDFEHNSETNSGQDNKCDCSHCPFAETKQVLDVINDPTRDVLAIFHVPWCTHCKNLGPVFEELRKHPARKSITIIKINSSRLNTSMAPELRVGAYPTIRFYGKNSKIGATYSGDHTLENLVHFVNSFKKSE
jgi:thiol-disulfide isomerase/thioredoxin